MDIGKSLSQSFEILKNNIGLLIGATLVAGFLSGCTLGILAGPLFGGVYLICLKLLRGEKAEFGEIFAHFDKIVPCLIFAAIIIGLGIGLMIVNTILAFIPILGWLLMFLIWLALGVASPLIGLTFAIALCAMMEQNLDAVSALKYGFNKIKDDLVMNWVYSFVISLVAGAGVIACGIGLLVTMPIAYIGMAIAYLQLNGSAQAPPSDVAPSI